MVSRLLQRRSSGPGSVEETTNAVVDSTDPAKSSSFLMKKDERTTARRRQRRRKTFPFFSRNRKAAATSDDCERRDEAAAFSLSNSSASSSSDVLLNRPARILVSSPAASSDSSSAAAAVAHRNKSSSTSAASKQQQQQRPQPQQQKTANDKSSTTALSVVEPPKSAAFCSSLAEHSYFARMCGVDTTTNAAATTRRKQRMVAENTSTNDGDNDDEDSSDSSSSSNYLNQVPDDPSVQESIECVLAATQHTIPILKEEEDEESGNNGFDDDDDAIDPFSHLQTPSSLQQCLLRNRSISALPPRMQSETRLLSPTKLPQRRDSLDDNIDFLLQLQERMLLEPGDKSDGQDSFNAAQAEAKAHAKAAETPHRHHPWPACCTCRNQRLPATPVDRWPQRPLLMRPTPHSGTVLKGIRYAGSTEYLWEAAAPAQQQQGSGGTSTTSPLQWPDALHQKWNKEASYPKASDDRMCPQCMIMPINNGKELPGESLVTDFESPGFVGSILVRLRDSQGTTCCPDREREPGDGYFDGVHRKYQVVVRGRFKCAVPWTDCLAGFQLERPCGKLPPKWIVKGALNVVSFFAPQLQTRIHGSRPFSLTPLGSTPQSLSVHEANEKESMTDTHMEIPLEEPLTCEHTLLGKASRHTSTMQRARFRKKNFDKLFAHRERTPVTDPNKVYTFEFLQHLLSFDDFEIQLGSIMGTIPLKNILDGQPLQIMASHKHPNPNQPNAVHNRLWCFDIWHEMLIPDAKRHEFGV